MAEMRGLTSGPIRERLRRVASCLTCKAERFVPRGGPLYDEERQADQHTLAGSKAVGLEAQG